jgi:hypothetical protein
MHTFALVAEPATLTLAAGPGLSGLAKFMMIIALLMLVLGVVMWAWGAKCLRVMLTLVWGFTGLLVGTTVIAAGLAPFLGTGTAIVAGLIAGVGIGGFIGYSYPRFANAALAACSIGTACLGAWVGVMIPSEKDLEIQRALASPVPMSHPIRPSDDKSLRLADAERGLPGEALKMLDDAPQSKQAGVGAKEPAPNDAKPEGAQAPSPRSRITITPSKPRTANAATPKQPRTPQSTPIQITGGQGKSKLGKVNVSDIADSVEKLREPSIEQKAVQHLKPEDAAVFGVRIPQTPAITAPAPKHIVIGTPAEQTEITKADIKEAIRKGSLSKIPWREIALGLLISATLAVGAFVAAFMRPKLAACVVTACVGAWWIFAAFSLGLTPFPKATALIRDVPGGLWMLGWMGLAGLGCAMQIMHMRANADKAVTADQLTVRPLPSTGGTMGSAMLAPGALYGKSEE